MNAPAQSKFSGSLSSLHEVELIPAYRKILESTGCGGPEPYRKRKLQAGHQLLALAQISERLWIQFLDLSGVFRAVFVMKVPVPCRRGGTGPLLIAPAAQLALSYRPEAMVTAQNGSSFFEILEPRDVFHANVAPSYRPPGAQVLCLGPQLFAGIQLVDLVLMAYGAISLQTTQFSLTDPAGLFNAEAAQWFQANPSSIPLTREPFRFHKEARV